MAYLVANVKLKAYTDTNQTEFPEQLVSNIEKEFTSSSVTEVQSLTISLAALGTQAITLNGVATVKRWYIYSSATDVTVEINGLSALTVQAAEPGYIPITLTSLTVNNASASTATTVTVVLIASS